MSCRLISERDKVATLVYFTGIQTVTHHIAGRTVPPSSQPFKEAEMFILRIADGKIVESWATRDRLSLLEQLGAVAIPRKPS
jgi:predicted ester cyclase